jgi:uncharacterized protein YlxW (UPF0749 family)
MNDLVSAILLVIAAIFFGKKYMLTRQESKLVDKNKDLQKDAKGLEDQLKELKKELDSIPIQQKDKDIQDNLDFWNSDNKKQ